MTPGQFVLALPRSLACVPGIVREMTPRPLREGSAWLWVSRDSQGERARQSR